MNKTANISADVHIYEMEEEGLSVLHWNKNGEDRYTVRISGITFYLSGDDYRKEFLPRMTNCLNDSVILEDLRAV
jgi:hypothetical protein